MLPLDYFLFLQIILFLFITPGTPRIVIISLSISFGVRNCVWVALGDVTANILQASLVIFLLHSFFLDNPNLLKSLAKLNGYVTKDNKPDVNAFLNFYLPLIKSRNQGS